MPYSRREQPGAIGKHLRLMDRSCRGPRHYRSRSVSKEGLVSRMSILLSNYRWHATTGYYDSLDHVSF